LAGEIARPLTLKAVSDLSHKKIWRKIKMTQDNDPIFPRRSERDEEEKQRLYREAGRNLENEERAFAGSEGIVKCASCGAESRAGAKFCRGCGNRFEPAKRMEDPFEPKVMQAPVEPKRMEEPASVVYGPPPVQFKERPDDDIHTTVYGPPPMMLDPAENNLPFPRTEPNLEIDKGSLPEPPAPFPAKKDSSDKFLFWIIGAVVLLGLLLITVAAIGILYFMFSR
jgi:hypothetical protein